MIYARVTNSRRVEMATRLKDRRYTRYECEIVPLAI